MDSWGEEEDALDCFCVGGFHCVVAVVCVSVVPVSVVLCRNEWHCSV